MPAFRSRLVIIGNSGSGKSTLAQTIASRTSQLIYDLDLIHWHDDGSKRDEDASRQMVSEIAEPSANWIIEGVYGWLAKVALVHATALVWTDLPWPDCRDGLQTRGLRRGMTETDQTALFAWAEAYSTWKTSSGAEGHRQLFEGFSGAKARLLTRQDAQVFVMALWARVIRKICAMVGASPFAYSADIEEITE